MRLSVGPAILISVLATGCAGVEMPTAMKGEPAIYPPAQFSHRVATSHVVLHWNCTRPESGVLRLDGVAHNPWSPQEVRFMELEVVGIDAEGRYVSQAATALPNFMLGTNQISPFQLEVKTLGTETRFDLFYRYRFQDNGGRSIVSGHLVGGRRLLAQVFGSMARDVCPEMHDRAR